MNIVAMGGGERTQAFSHSIELTGSEKPAVLIIPTACSTEPSYGKKVPLTLQRFRQLGVEATVLHDFGERPSREQLTHELGRASLIYTIGGNTPYMLEELNTFGGFDALCSALRSGTVHAGTSAGALLPFELAHSNVAKKPVEEEWDYEYLTTLGVVQGVATAHANQHDPTPGGIRADSRLQALIATFPLSVDVGYAIDNDASLVMTEAGTIAISERHNAGVHVLNRGADGIIADRLS